MRVPEDYIMGTGKKKDNGSCLADFIIVAVIAGVVGYFTGTLPIILVVGGALLVICLLVFVIYVACQTQKDSKERKALSSANVSQLTPIQYEEYIALRMKELNYRNVRTTKASGDFGADVLCEYKDGRKVCIQCKHYSQPVGVEAVQQVIGAKAYYKCDEAWVCASNTFTPAAHEMARKTGVKLYTIK